MAISITPAQCRAGRALVDLSQKALAVKAGISKQTLVSFESGRSIPHAATLAVIASALEHAGVVLIEENGNGPGVCLRKS